LFAVVDIVSEVSGVEPVPNSTTDTNLALPMDDKAVQVLALEGIEFTEVHLSNVYKREDFRKKSYFSDIAQGVISGFGAQGYEFALSAAIKYIKSKG
jgi:3-dehydroquinate dehydratase